VAGAWRAVLVTHISVAFAKTSVFFEEEGGGAGADTFVSA
jgi:hypothetical protein